jgi:hypothetical protein
VWQETLKQTACNHLEVTKASNNSIRCRKRANTLIT